MIDAVQCELARIRRAARSQEAELNHSWPPTCRFLTSQTSVLWIIGFRQWYRSGSINKLC